MSKKKEDSGNVSLRMRTFKVESDATSVVNALLNPDGKSSSVAEPPLSPEKLTAMFDISSSLRPNIEAYVTNIASRGYHFDSSIDLNSPDAVDRVKEAMFVEKLINAWDGDLPIDDIEEPNEEEVEKKIKEVKKQATLELAIANRFFSNCYPDGSFIDLNKLTIQDRETTGNSYWEILRGENNRPRNVYFIPSSSMRLAKQSAKDKKEIPVKIFQRVTGLTWEVVKVNRSFKKFVQLDDANKPSIYFKEFGDPRLMSRQTGKYYSSIESLVKSEGRKAQLATEVFHFDIPSTISDYGMPRWAGNIPAVLGSRELDETNLDYFLSNAVPALALLCAGGRFGKQVEERLKEFFAEEVRGRRATHKLIVLEAEAQRRTTAGGPSAAPRIDFVPLRNAQVQDALFQNYDERNTQKVSRSFRIPISLLGGGRFNVNDLRFAEEQVYQPEREGVDSKINKFLMPALGVKFWEFKLNPTMARDPEVMGSLALRAAEIGVTVPSEARKTLGKVFNQDFPAIKAIWAEQPIPFTMAALGVAAGPAQAVREQGRQAGNAPPIEQLLRELGLTPEEAIERLGADEEGNIALSDEQISSALAALQTLKPLGLKIDRDKDE